MKQTIDKALFIQAFENHNRVDNFGYAGLDALFNYLEEYEDSCDREIELDVIALCYDYTHYDNLEECLAEYDINTLEELQDYTSVIEMDNGEIIIQPF